MRSTRGGRAIFPVRTALTAAVTVVVTVAAVAAAASTALPAGAATNPLAPTITGLSLNHDASWGGRSVTITGTNLTGVRSVVFGTAQAWIDSQQSSSITVEDPGGAVGHVDVRVSTANGTSAVVAADRFTFTTPTMNDPINGGWTANQEIAVDAKFQRNAATLEHVPVAPKHPFWTANMAHTAAQRALAWVGLPYSWDGGVANSPSRGVCDTSQGSGGLLDCHVWGFDCSGLALYAWGAYLNLPHFAASQVAAGKFHPSGSELEPGDLLFYSAGESGIGHVVIYIGGGKVVQASESGYPVMITPVTSMANMAGTYRGAVRPASTGTQGSAPTVTSISSGFGSMLGGQTLTVHGTGFDTATSVLFGSALTYQIKVLSPTTLTVTVPAAHAGTVDVRVGGAWGVSPITPHDHFTYGNAPAITSLAPLLGSTAGGQLVTITGHNLLGVDVSFGGVAASAVLVVSDTTVVATAPPHLAGGVTVSVAGRYGTATAPYSYG